MKDPQQAKVFLVGKNQAKTFPEAAVGSHAKFLDALFNRNGMDCRRLYDAVTEGKPSPTRKNLNRLARLLAQAGVNDVLETNVICYSTPTSDDLARREHAGGRERGDTIFRTLLEYIRPPVIIAHGVDTRKTLARVLGAELPECTLCKDQLALRRIECGDYRPWVFIIPSLSPPAFNKWKDWADAYLHTLSAQVAEILSQHGDPRKPRQDETIKAPPPTNERDFQTKGRTIQMNNQNPRKNSDEWVAMFLRWFRIYGGGDQTSRVAFCLPQNEKRVCKLETMAQGHRLSLMTRNYGVDMSRLADQLKSAGFLSRAQEKYLEVPVRTIEEAKEVLRIFMSLVPERDRVQID